MEAWECYNIAQMAFMNCRSSEFLLYFLVSLVLAAPSWSQSDWDFELITDEGDLIGCWQRVLYPADVMQKMNRIQLYDEAWEMFENQYFCFEENRELYTLMSNSPDRSGMSARELLGFMKMFPCVERYKLLDRGVVLIEHLEARQTTVWLTSIVTGSEGAEPQGNIRLGDLLMTIRNMETGDDPPQRPVPALK